MIRDLTLSLEKRLLNAIGNSDYNASSVVLEEILFEGRLDEITQPLHRLIDHEPDLRVRDHVAFFLSIEPIYCSLEVPSYALLNIVKDSRDRYHAAQDLFEYVRELVDSRDPLFNQKTLRIEKTAATAYSVITPEILYQRIQEMEDCMVLCTMPPALHKGKPKYHIGMLLNTKYGESIIRSFPTIDNQPIVGETVWKEIEAALLEVGFDPKYREIPYEDWYDHVKSLENSEPKKKSKYDQQSEREIGLLRLLVTVEEAIEKNISSSSPENASLLKHNLKLMKNLQTRHFNNELIEMISFVGKRESLEPILEILIQTRDPQIENILNVFLESKDRLIRDIAARGLAKLNALESPLSTGDPAQLGFIAISELLAASQKTSATRRVARSAIPLLAKSKSSVARRDLVKVLVQLFDSETQEIFFNLLSDPNEEVGLEVLSQISKLPSQLTRGILRAALESPHEQIALKAERTLLDFEI
jgi:hypothetical protein